MIFARAGARGEVHNGAGIAAILRGKRRVVDLVFREGINGRLERDLVLNVVVEIDSVDQPVGSVFALPGGVDTKRALATERRREKAICRWRDRTGRQQTEVRE